MGPASNIGRTLSGILGVLRAWRGRGLCTGRERGEGTSSRDAPELCIAVSASAAGGAVVGAARGRTGCTSVGPAGDDVRRLELERLRMLCARRGRGLCTRCEGADGTSSRDAPELCIAVSASPAGSAAVEAASRRIGWTSVRPATGNVGTLEFERLRMSCARRRRDLCTRCEGADGTSSGDAPELCIAVSASPAGGAAVEAASRRTG